MFTIDIEDARLKQENYLREAKTYRLIKSLGGVKFPTTSFRRTLQGLVAQLLFH